MNTLYTVDEMDEMKKEEERTLGLWIVGGIIHEVIESALAFSYIKDLASSYKKPTEIMKGEISGEKALKKEYERA